MIKEYEKTKTHFRGGPPVCFVRILAKLEVYVLNITKDDQKKL